MLCAQTHSLFLRAEPNDVGEKYEGICAERGVSELLVGVVGESIDYNLVCPPSQE